MSATTAIGLEFARKLGELLNVPLIACPPKQGEEFHYPTGDRDKLSADDNANQLDRWQPGWAIMARTGGPVADVDVDPRNGGDIEKTRQLLDGLNVRIFAEVATPSDGRHFYIAGHPELPSTSNLDGWPGIDILSFGKIVFLPGTQRPKYNGAGYRMIFDNLDALADGGDPDGAEAFADWVASRRGRGEQFTTSQPWQGGEPDARQAKYLAAMLAGIHRDLSAMGKDSGRNTAVYNKAMKCGNYIAGAGLNETPAIDVLLDASRENGLVKEDGESSVLASIRSGIKNGRARPRAVPEPGVVIDGNFTDGDTDDDALPAPGDPMGVARILIRDQQTAAGELKLRHWRGSWMEWQETHWIEAEDKAIRSWLYQRLEDAKYWHVTTQVTELRPWNPNRRKIGDVIEALAAVAHTPEWIDTPSWLAPARSGTQWHARNDTKYCATEIVACSNGLLHVGSRELLKLTPLFFNRVAVPFEHESAAPEPMRWLKFLDQLWPDDSESINALQEFFGYVLSGRTDLHKIMLLIGPTRSGKGTIARVLERLLGKGNVAGPTLASLGTNFGLSPLLGKPLAVVSDARLAGSNVHQVVERLLSISGEDLLTVDRKFREPWSGKLPSRFLILSNELPRFGDASGAIANRFVVLAMHESFLGRENASLTEELTAELTGILSWSLDGLDRLNQQGKFTEPKASKDSILALQDLVSPTAAFVRDRCEVGIGHEVAVADLFKDWRLWCELNGHKAGSVQTFGRDLRAVIPTILVAQPRVDGGRERHFQGVRLQPFDTTTHVADESTARNGAVRVPPRATDPNSAPNSPDSALARDGTRENPLRPVLQDAPPPDPVLADGAVQVNLFADEPEDVDVLTPAAQTKKRLERGICAVCGDVMTITEDGQTTHPGCEVVS